MKISIFYLMKGDAQKYQKKLVKELAKLSGERYLIENPLPNHITLKSPFETGKIKEVERVVEEVCSRNKKGKVKIRNFGNFRKFVSFFKIELSPEAKKVQRDLVKSLKEIGIEPHEFDLKFKPHSTLCYGNTPETFKIIWDYLKNIEKPNFDLEFDEVAIMKKVGGRWRVLKEVRIK